ncbi:FAD:protein FMN transferase [Fundicoccus culcitae]|uniref:FAD:protein FMN transferase n=1 Tax=Fundicoccus culcitae TaxID=2969821 RepID=A0ABY5P5G4_9LACT|nr:FAD:protein FMN transferase [Fundicoccus culcitae]UUX33951.1 FAD:protein FMN transferase [Fundicoccus culcitae]
MSLTKTKHIIFTFLVIFLVGSQTIEASNQASSSDVDVTSTASPVEEVEPLPVSSEPLTRTESMLHTAVQIQIYHEGQEEAMQAAFDYMAEMERNFSTNLEGSDVYRINQAAGQEFVQVNPETYAVIERAIEIAELSDGKFDITIGAITNLWQIGSEDARVPSDEEIQAALSKIDYKKIALDPQNHAVMLEEEGMVMELGGISKGYIGGRIVDIFKPYGITTAIINLGGNVVVMGNSPTNETGWNVGVQDPDKSRGSIVGTQRVIDGAVVTSGIYERYLEQDGHLYHHIMDPETGYPLDNEISGVTVFAETSFDGDSYSTALFLFGIEDGIQFVEQTDGIEAVFIDKDKGVHLTSGLKDTFELTNEEYHIVD